MPKSPCGRISSTKVIVEIDQKQCDALEIGFAERIGDADQQEPTKAPRRLPMPPITMTMKAGMRISVSMPG